MSRRYLTPARRACACARRRARQARVEGCRKTRVAVRRRRRHRREISNSPSRLGFSGHTTGAIGSAGARCAMLAARCDSTTGTEYGAEQRRKARAYYFDKRAAQGVEGNVCVNLCSAIIPRNPARRCAAAAGRVGLSSSGRQNWPFLFFDTAAPAKSPGKLSEPPPPLAGRGGQVTTVCYLSSAAPGISRQLVLVDVYSLARLTAANRFQRRVITR